MREGSRPIEAFFGWIIVALIHHFLVKCCAFPLGREMGKNSGNGNEETSARQRQNGCYSMGVDKNKEACPGT